MLPNQVSARGLQASWSWGKLELGQIGAGASVTTQNRSWGISDSSKWELGHQ